MIVMCANGAQASPLALYTERKAGASDKRARSERQKSEEKRASETGEKRERGMRSSESTPH